MSGDRAMRAPHGLGRHPPSRGCRATERRQPPAPRKRPHSHTATPPAWSRTPAPGAWLAEAPSPKHLGGDGPFIVPQDSRFKDMPHPARRAHEFGVLKEWGLGATANAGSFHWLQALQELTWVPNPAPPSLPARRDSPSGPSASRPCGGGCGSSSSSSGSASCMASSFAPPPTSSRRAAPAGPSPGDLGSSGLGFLGWLRFRWDLESESRQTGGEAGRRGDRWVAPGGGAGGRSLGAGRRGWWGGQARADGSWRWDGGRGPERWGGAGVWPRRRQRLGERRGDAWSGGCTYGGPGLLLCSLLLSRVGFLSSSVFLQCLLSFRLICLERKRQGVFLWHSRQLPGTPHLKAWHLHLPGAPCSLRPSPLRSSWPGAAPPLPAPSPRLAHPQCLPRGQGRGQRCPRTWAWASIPREDSS